jgi:hypothetical protein
MVENIIVKNNNHLVNQSEKKSADLENQLYEPIWAVVTFDSVVAHHLTYEEAKAWAEKLEKQMQNGICIITDEAAEKMFNKENHQRTS